MGDHSLRRLGHQTGSPVFLTKPVAKFRLKLNPRLHRSALRHGTDQRAFCPALVVEGQQASVFISETEVLKRDRADRISGIAQNNRIRLRPAQNIANDSQTLLRAFVRRPAGRKADRRIFRLLIEGTGVPLQKWSQNQSVRDQTVVLIQGSADQIPLPINQLQ